MSLILETCPGTCPYLEDMSSETYLFTGHISIRHVLFGTYLHKDMSWKKTCPQICPESVENFREDMSFWRYVISSGPNFRDMSRNTQNIETYLNERHVTSRHISTYPSRDMSSFQLKTYPSEVSIFSRHVFSHKRHVISTKRHIFSPKRHIFSLKRHILYCQIYTDGPAPKTCNKNSLLNSPITGCFRARV